MCFDAKKYRKHSKIKYVWLGNLFNLCFKCTRKTHNAHRKRMQTERWKRSLLHLKNVRVAAKVFLFWCHPCASTISLNYFQPIINFSNVTNNNNNNANPNNSNKCSESFLIVQVKDITKENEKSKTNSR